MKIAKLSLAAIVAVGAMSTFANAASLEQAIKGVNVDGFIRYRGTADDNDGTKTNTHQYTSVFNLTIPVAKNVTSGVLLTVNGANTTQQAAADYNSGLSYDLGRVWFQYAAKGLSVKVGKQEVFTPWTDPGYRGTVGDGVTALYTGVKNWTFGAVGFTNTNITVAGAQDKNVMGVGAIGALGPVALQVWGANVQKTIDYSLYVDAVYEMKGFNFEAQVNMLKLNKDIMDETDMFFGVKGGYAAKGFSAELGYTKNGDKHGYYTLAADDAMGFIFSGGKQINGTVANVADANLMFVDLGYTRNQFGAELGFAMAKQGSDDIGKEIYVGGAYNYSSKFKLSTFYSMLDMEDDSKDNKRARIEAKYSF